jgi:ABC-type branched-subunit amino acid transport system substrate-binding protein
MSESRSSLHFGRSLSGTRPRTLAGFGIGVLLASCTLTRTDVDECRTNADCRTAFGSARVCAPDGLCRAAPPYSRCTRTLPTDLLARPESYPNVIILGSLAVTQVGAQTAREKAVRLAVTQANEQGGLDGRSFGVVFCDVSENAAYDSLRRTEAVLASGRYLTDVIGARAIVGPSASPDTLALFETLAGSDVLVMSPSATSPELTSADVAIATDEMPGLLWRTAAPDTIQGAAVASYLQNLTPAVKNVSVIYERGAYGEGLERIFRGAFAKDRTVRAIAYGSGVSSERDAAILDAASTSPQFVLFFSSQAPDQSAFVNAVASLPSYSGIQLFLSDTAANKDLLVQAAQSSSVFPRITGSRPSVPFGPVYELFQTSYIAAYNEDPSAYTFVPHAYDATWLVLYGTAFSLRREHHLTGSGIARGIRRIASSGEAIPITPGNWQRIANEIVSDKRPNLTGASGRLDYDPVAEETSGSVDIWKISEDGNSIVTLSTIDP